MPSPALRQNAEAQAAALPALLARAEHLAGTVLLGEHGRRRAGMGDDFWQYRPVQPGDSRRMIDWRRSARSDAQYVREREWQVAQSMQMWIDTAASMRFSSHHSIPAKADRARLLALSLSILLIRGGERVGLTGTHIPPRSGRTQILRLSDALEQNTGDDYATPDVRTLLPHASAVFISDFLGDANAIETALTSAADKGTRGTLVQILDPSEESFPFSGRTIFESAGQTLKHETLKASELRQRYLDRLAERKDLLQRLSRATGWQYTTHHTDQPAQSALLWLYRAMEQHA